MVTLFFLGVGVVLFLIIIDWLVPPEKEKEDSHSLTENSPKLKVSIVSNIDWSKKNYSDSEEDYISSDEVRKILATLPKSKWKNNEGAIPEGMFLPGPWTLTLVLLYSRAMNFDMVLNLAKQAAQNWKEEDKRFIFDFDAEHLPQFKRIYDLCKSWKGCFVYIYGDLMEKRQLSDILRCAVDRTNALNNPSFCYGLSSYTDNPFGCHRCSIKNNSWFNFVGPLHSEYVEIDKKRILETIQHDIKEYRYCPFLKPAEIWQNFLSLPERIYLNDPNYVIYKTLSGGVEVRAKCELFWGRIPSWEDLRLSYGDRLLSKEK